MRLAPALVGLALLALASAARAAPPVVAVDEISTRGLELGAEPRRMLGEYLAARVASLPGLRVLPRPEVMRALWELQREAVSRCGKGPCPIELGRELAASKVLAPTVVALGKTCVAMLTFFDIKTATAEAAGTAGGACGDADLAASFHRALLGLAGRLRGSAASAPASMGRPPVRMVSVFFSSRPVKASVLLDGVPRGDTPLRLDLVAGETHRVALKGPFPYGTYQTTIRATEWQEVHARLDLEEIGRWEVATTPEWFSLGLGSGVSLDTGQPLFSFLIRAATLKWRYLFLSILDASVGAGFEPELDKMMSIGSRVAFPIHLGSRGRHQLLLGCGLHYAGYERPDDARSLFSASPGVEYVFVASNGTAFLGGEARALLPLAGELGGMVRPYQVLFVLRFGFSLTPVLRRARREAGRR